MSAPRGDSGAPQEERRSQNIAASEPQCLYSLLLRVWIVDTAAAIVAVMAAGVHYILSHGTHTDAGYALLGRTLIATNTV